MKLVMDNGFKFGPEAFVEFLNSSASRDSCFQLRDMVGNVFRRAVKYEVVRDDMVGKRFIERCAKIWHSVGLVKMGDKRNKVYYGDERLEVYIPREIILSDDKLVVPQRFVLRRLFGDGQEAVGLNYKRGLRQLGYENGIWKFAD